MEFWEVARRAEVGPMMKESDFDMKISMTAMELAKEHDIVYDPSVYVSSDDSMADDVWQAGLELLLRCGVYNVSNKRVITFAEDEVKNALRHVVAEFEIGKGKDRIKIRSRKVEDRTKPTIFSGAFGVETTLDMFVPFNQAFVQEPLIDVLFHGGHIQSIDGITTIRANSAFEVIAARIYAELMNQALILGGRPFMPIVWGVAAGVSSLNELGADSIMPRNPEDILRAVMFLPELKLDDVLLSKTAHFMNYGYPLYAGTTPVIGGYAGDANTAAIVAVAEQIATNLVFGALVNHIGPQHMRYRSQTNPASLWMNSVMGQAVARNSNLITTTSVTTAGRPGSMQMHLEGAAMAISSVVSGRNLLGPRPAQPLYPNHHNPLHSRLFAEVAHAATKLKREEANEIVAKLVLTYKDTLDFDKSPKGKPFEQSYDVKTLKPTEENLNLYREAKAKLIDLGLELEI
ncbi:MAG: monomethylamine:corrinoid methyltransferase [Candidatus Hadarchaeum sp.]|uniref:monomethylamine:corrinoid methyltransferase n=1 Tax=Candidatus Hadarchaeum sp. TaxID=2883567 RepID=UPI00317EB55D